MRYDAVLFDLDGTLTESEPGITSSIRYAIERLGLPAPDEATLRTLIGPPLMEGLMNLGLEEATAREGVRIYRERFSVEGWCDNSVYTGIPALLRTLKARGVYVALATAKPEKFARMILEHFGIARYFDKVSAVRMDQMHADKADLIRDALPPGAVRAAMVGDRLYDMRGAKACGVEAIGVLYGYGSREELESAGADYVAGTVRDLTGYLLGDEPLARGAFITMEGMDGSGKTTQIDMLAGWLRKCGHEVDVTREPGGCPISEAIRQILLAAEENGLTDAAEMLLFAAARAQHVSDRILPALAAGRLVLCDRFEDSSVAFQGGGRELGEELVRAVNAPAKQGLEPDITVLLALAPELSIARRRERGAMDRIEQQDAGFHGRVHDAYIRLAGRNPQRVILIDASREVGEIAQTVCGRVMERLNAW